VKITTPPPPPPQIIDLGCVQESLAVDVDHLLPVVHTGLKDDGYKKGRKELIN